MKNRYTVHWNEGDGFHGDEPCSTLKKAKAVRKECLAAGWEVIVTDEKTGKNILGQKCMACDLLVGMMDDVSMKKMEKIVLKALAKAGIKATLSTVEIVEGTIKK